ncbi:CheR family methyltransferase [Magnetofaba australis]|uniref:protein-glutamate O-methyltransferase n=1 Tax=Magnetofaba australis IT-1 TaxID=1434232 RepID=A0A1Y2KA92_9PROT|nr:protein-glutamate O-methyltransferase CheR [Magnetofaba australis]OSM06281.1 putative chemotaxis protein CheR [Magnetofaba australis IT-1]
MAITPEEFKNISQYIHDHSGITIGPGKEYLVENRLTVLLVQNGCETFAELHKKLLADTGALRSKVIDAMTTNETLWFRDASFFNALSDYVIPDLLRKAKTRPKIRIWSAASSTGQEAYSVAMLINEGRLKMGASAPPLDKFSIVGTDISPSSVFIAKAGRYSQLAISRGMKKEFLERYFVKNGMAYEVSQEIRSLVEFKLFNLKDSYAPLGTFDLVLCRNVLIYFTDELKGEIYGKINRALQKDGLLAIGASESPRGYTKAFEQVMYGGAAMYKPSGGGGAVAAAPRAAAPAPAGARAASAPTASTDAAENKPATLRPGLRNKPLLRPRPLNNK